MHARVQAAGQDSLSPHMAHLPEELAQLILRLLAYVPSARPTVAAALTDLIAIRAALP